MTFKSIVLTVILLLGSLGIAAAQSSEPHGTLGKVEPGEGGTTEAVVIGWNFYHVFACASRPGFGFTWVSQEDPTLLVEKTISYRTKLGLAFIANNLKKAHF